MKNRAEFDAYIAAYSGGDYPKVLRDYYTPDIIFDSATGGHFEGTEAVLGFLNRLHEKVIEVLKPQVVLFGPENMSAEILADFEATADAPDFHYRPLKKGDTFSLRFFVSYYLRGDKIRHVKIATWPLGRL
jgi:hypothetical protein